MRVRATEWKTEFWRELSLVLMMPVAGRNKRKKAGAGYFLGALKNVFHVLIYEFNMGNRFHSHLLVAHRTLLYQ